MTDKIIFNGVEIEIEGENLVDIIEALDFVVKVRKKEIILDKKEYKKMHWVLVSGECIEDTLSKLISFYDRVGDFGCGEY